MFSKWGVVPDTQEVRQMREKERSRRLFRQSGRSRRLFRQSGGTVFGKCRSGRSGFFLVIFSALLSVSGVPASVMPVPEHRSPATVKAQTSLELKRQYALKKQSADSNRNTVQELMDEIKKVNRRMIKESGQMEEHEGEIRLLEEKIRSAEQKVIRYQDAEKAYFDRCAYAVCRGSVTGLAGLYLEHLYQEFDPVILEELYLGHTAEGEKEYIEQLTEKKQEKEDEWYRYERKQADFGAELSELSDLVKEMEKKAGDAGRIAEELEKEADRLAAKERELSYDSGDEDWYSSAYDTGDGTGYFQVSRYGYTEAELELLAGIIEAEAGSGSYPGMVAVGSVVMNRVDSPKFSDTIRGVVYAPYQFQPVRTGRLAVILARGPAKACRKAAKDVLEGKRNVRNLYFKAAWYAKKHGITGINIGGNVFH